MHLIVDEAETAFDLNLDPEWIDQLPAAEDDDDFDVLPDLLLQDTDVLMLFNPALDGIEDPDTPIARQLGTACLHPNEWFKQFDGFSQAG